ncbi:hypothetical protein EON68_04345, partial [archaeon]
MGLGMDGAGGLSESVSRYLSGQGSIHAYSGVTMLRMGGSGGTGDAPFPLPRGLSTPPPVVHATMGNNGAGGGGLSARVAGLASASPKHADAAAVSAAAVTPGERAANPMLLPDHPYLPYEYDYQHAQRQVLEAALRVGADSAAHPRVVYAYLKHLWYSGHKEQAIAQLKRLTATLDAHRETRLALETAGRPVSEEERAAVNAYGRYTLSAEEENALRVQCYLRLGQWQLQSVETVVANYSTTAGGLRAMAHMDGGGGAQSPTVDAGSSTSTGESSATRMQRSTSSASNQGSGGVGAAASASAFARALNRMPSDAYAALVSPVLTSFRTATHDCADNGLKHYRAWHAWAITNFTAAEHHN